MEGGKGGADNKVTTSGNFGTCPALQSAAISFANSGKFSLKSISEAAIGRGLVAASCKPSGWDYSLVFPKFDRRGEGWISEGFKSIMGKCSTLRIDWDEKVHRVFKNDRL